MQSHAITGGSNEPVHNNHHHDISAKVDFTQLKNTSLSQPTRCSSVGCRLAWLLTGGISLGVVGGLGLRHWYTSDWMTTAHPRTREGFTLPEFMGLLIACMTIPVSFMLLFTALQRILRHTAECIQLPAHKPPRGQSYTTCDMIIAPGAPTYLFLTLVCISLLWCMAAIGGAWSWDVLRCAIVACVDTNKYPAHPDEPEYAWGFNHSIGLTAFVGGALLGFTMLFSYIVSIRTRLRAANATLVDAALEAPVGGYGSNGVSHSLLPDDDDANHNGDSKNAIVPTYRQSCGRAWLWYMAWLVFVLVWYILGSMLPNSWTGFSASALAAFAAKLHSNVWPECNQYPKYSCPEVGDATFITRNWEFYDMFIIKIFPDNAFLYAFLAAAPGIALALRSFTRTNTCISRKVLICSTNKGRDHWFVSYGQLLFGTGMVAMIFCFTWYWGHDHNYSGSWDGTSVKILRSERITRTLGQVASLIMALLMFPAARNSLIPVFFGVSWESSIKWHKWLGIAFLLVALGHMIGAWFWYRDSNTFPNDIIAIPMKLESGRDNFTIPLAQWALWLALPALALAMFSQFRRKRFETFMNLHHIAYATLIPATLWHAQAAWQFLMPSLTVWFIDRCIRAYRSSRAVPLVDIVAYDCHDAGKIVELRTSSTNITYYPGQYMFINISQISLLEWHPFTLSCATAGQLVWHIKSMGDNTWTDRLYQLAVARAALATKANPTTKEKAATSLTISVDGPYGLAHDFSHYNTLILVAGGIGITPCKAIFESLRATYQSATQSSSTHNRVPRRVHLIWVLRDIALASIWQHTLEEFASGIMISPVGQMQQPFSIQLYAPTPCPPGEDDAKRVAGDPTNCHCNILAPLILHRRPNLTEELPLITNPSSASIRAGRHRSRRAFPSPLSSMYQDLEAGVSTPPDHHTESSSSSSSMSPLKVATDANGYGDHHDNDSNGSRTMLFVCGPDRMTTECEHIAHRNHWQYHTEIFDL